MISSFWRQGITFATVHATDEDVRLYDDPQVFIRKAAAMY